VTIPSGTRYGIYRGSFMIFEDPDGGDGTDFDTLETVGFSVQVTPEPPGWQLVAIALLGFPSRNRLELPPASNGSCTTIPAEVIR